MKFKLLLTAQARTQKPTILGPQKASEHENSKVDRKERETKKRLELSRKRVLLSLSHFEMFILRRMETFSVWKPRRQ